MGASGHTSWYKTAWLGLQNWSWFALNWGEGRTALSWTSLFLCRMFFGKNKVMMVALGRSPCEEYRDNLHQVSVPPSLGGARARLSSLLPVLM